MRIKACIFHETFSIIRYICRRIKTSKKIHTLYIPAGANSHAILATITCAYAMTNLRFGRSPRVVQFDEATANSFNNNRAHERESGI